MVTGFHTERLIYHYFFLLCFVAMVLAWIGQYVLLPEELFFEYFGEQLAYDRIVEVVAVSKRWEWFGYVLIPCIYFIKIFFVACCLAIGVLTTNLKVSFRSLLHVAVVSEFVFLTVPLVRVFWFGIFFTDYTFLDLQKFYPLSILNFLDLDSIDIVLLYPLSLLNLFELLYWIFLAKVLTSVTQEQFKKMLGLVASSYGIGLLLWVLVVVFLTVNVS